MNMSERGRLGGIASHGTTMAQHRRDVEECRAYLAALEGLEPSDYLSAQALAHVSS